MGETIQTKQKAEREGEVSCLPVCVRGKAYEHDTH